MQATKKHLTQKDGGCQFLGVAEIFLQDSWIFRFSQNLGGTFFLLAQPVRVAVGCIPIRLFFCENSILNNLTETLKNLAENFPSLTETHNHYYFF